MKAHIVLNVIGVMCAIAILVVLFTTKSTNKKAVLANIDTRAVDSQLCPGNLRIEQMFVKGINDGYDCILVDNNGYAWNYETYGLGLYEDVLALLSDNNTEDISDDAIVHIWIGYD